MKNYCLSIIAVLLLMTNSSAFSQCMMVPVTLQERVQQSEIIAEGKVISQNSFWDNSHFMIYTAYDIEIYKIFKGNFSSGKITVFAEGGQVDNDRLIVEPGITLNAGQAGMFFIHPSRYNISRARGTSVNYELYAASQGFINYDLLKRTAHEPFGDYGNIETDLYMPVLSFTGRTTYIEKKPVDFFRSVISNKISAPPVISTVSPLSTYAGTLGANLLTITGSSFGASYVSGTSKLEFKNANDGGATYITTPDNHIKTWSSTSITAWIPTGAGSGTIKVTNSTGETTTSASSLTINYNELNVISGGIYYLPDLVTDNGAGGYTYVYNTTFSGNTSAVAAFERALETWRCTTFVNLTRSGTTAIDTSGSDGVNVVTFDGSSPLSAGVLGTAYRFLTSCSTGVWYLTETDIKFRTSGTGGITWNYGPAATTAGFHDFESVCVHELGHAHQLGHTILSPPSVMHWSISSATDRRTLVSTSEVDGGDDIMSRSTVSNSCGPSAMTALTSGTCELLTAPVADFSASDLVICRNDKIDFTDLSTNSPTSWTWTFTGATPSSSTVQHPTGIKYTTTGTFTVSLTATNGAGSDTETKTAYITVNALPSATITPGGPTEFCPGGSVLLSANTGAGLTYQWKKGSANISGATASTYTANATGNYKVVVTNASECSKTSSATSVTKYSNPTATITPDGPTTFCPGDSVVLTANSGAGLTYQWKKGSSNISGATAISYTAKTSGTYKVKVTNSDGCSKTSAGTDVTATCRTAAENLSSFQFVIHPNPSNDFFTIEWNDEAISQPVVKVYDVMGRVVDEMNIESGATQISAGENLIPGIYLIEVFGNGKSAVTRWIKTK